jgi:hypothetical protein
MVRNQLVVIPSIFWEALIVKIILITLILMAEIIESMFYVIDKSGLSIIIYTI